ncbi:hypothetical protein J4Q44_G00163530 [Coregonus suidteri]|uniref:Peptidase metallopeptidase domain-containing protein n=1 Tax=Coregonus suidteri TaxID=861788 RepID=A0AAN8M6R7_9TELE
MHGEGGIIPLILSSADRESGNLRLCENTQAGCRQVNIVWGTLLLQWLYYPEWSSRNLKPLLLSPSQSSESTEDTTEHHVLGHTQRHSLRQRRPCKSRTGNTNRPLCGVPDYPTLKDVIYRGRHRQKRFVLFGGRLEKTDLTYKVVCFPWQMSEDKVQRVLLEALRVWSEVTPLTFMRYWHGDNLPFDGPGDILANAFFPKTHREGEIHFDYDEAWSLGNYMGTDLLQVAAHEFRHVLGLQHPRNRAQ